MTRLLSDVDPERCSPWRPAELSPAPPPGAEGGPEAAGDLQAARRRAQAELEVARRNADQILAEARQQGRAEGIAAGEAQIKDKLDALDELMAAFDKRRDEFFERMQKEVVDLAVEIASKVVRREVEINPELVLDQVQGCIMRLREREKICVRVNPDDVESIRAAKESLIERFDGVKQIDVIEDRRVGRGGCIVESERGVLDARLDRQLGEIETSLLEANANGSRT